MPDVLAAPTAPINYNEFVDGFLNLVKSLGWTKALVLTLFFGGALTIWFLMRAMIKGKNEEIGRLIHDNNQYRTIYLAGLDQQRGLRAPGSKTSPQKKTKP